MAVLGALAADARAQGHGHARGAGAVSSHGAVVPSVPEIQNLALSQNYSFQPYYDGRALAPNPSLQFQMDPARARMTSLHLSLAAGHIGCSNFVQAMIDLGASLQGSVGNFGNSSQEAKMYFFSEIRNALRMRFADSDGAEIRSRIEESFLMLLDASSSLNTNLPQVQGFIAQLATAVQQNYLSHVASKGLQSRFGCGLRAPSVAQKMPELPSQAAQDEEEPITEASDVEDSEYEETEASNNHSRSAWAEKRDLRHEADRETRMLSRMNEDRVRDEAKLANSKEEESKAEKILDDSQVELQKQRDLASEATAKQKLAEKQKDEEAIKEAALVKERHDAQLAKAEAAQKAAELALKQKKAEHARQAEIAKQAELKRQAELARLERIKQEESEKKAEALAAQAAREAEAAKLKAEALAKRQTEALEAKERQRQVAEAQRLKEEKAKQDAELARKESEVAARAHKQAQEKAEAEQKQALDAKRKAELAAKQAEEKRQHELASQAEAKAAKLKTEALAKQAEAKREQELAMKAKVAEQRATEQKAAELKRQQELARQAELQRQAEIKRQAEHAKKVALEKEEEKRKATLAAQRQAASNAGHSKPELRKPAAVTAPVRSPTTSARAHMSSFVKAGVSKPALEAAMKAYEKHVAAGNVRSQKHLVVTDLTYNATNKRFWVLDLQTGKVLLSAFAAHGSGNGIGRGLTNPKDRLAYLSNEGGSNASTWGSMIIEGRDSSSGKDDPTELRGLDPHNRKMGNGPTNQGYRLIKIHSESRYFYPSRSGNPNSAPGNVGRSSGCPVLYPEHAKWVQKYVPKGTFMYAYPGDLPVVKTAKEAQRALASM